MRTCRIPTPNAAALKKTLRVNRTFPYLDGGWSFMVPPGKSGDVRVDHFTIDWNAYTSQLMSFAHHPVPVGKWCRLVIGGELMMSNTPWERATCRKILEDGHGDILILGLGLGCVVRDLLKYKRYRQSPSLKRTRM